MANEINHVAIIPDGNRRWAQSNGLKIWKGHEKAGSFENLSALFRESKAQGIKYTSLWGFSTENWNRDKKEVDKILEIISAGVDSLREVLHEEKFGFKHIGRKDRIPKELAEKFEELEVESQEYEDNYILICVDYGGRDETVRAVNKILRDGKSEVNETIYSSYLDTAGIPDPDLIIRTGGEKRFSGFMPFQAAYSELYFSDVYFPDFGTEQLREAIEDFRKRKRRFGQ